MTIDRMTLKSLVEKGSDDDLLREMMAYVANRMMDMEVESLRAALARGEGLPADIKALGITEADLGPARLWKNGPAVKPAPLAGH